MYDIDAREHRSRESNLFARRLATLRSMLQKYPQAKLLRNRVGFGVLLPGNRYLDMLYSPGWTNADLIEWLEGFAALLGADPDILTKRRFEGDGGSFAETVQKL